MISDKEQFKRIKRIEKELIKQSKIIALAIRLAINIRQ